MNYARKWEKWLARRYGTQEARRLIFEAESVYEKAWAEDVRQWGRGNQKSLRLRILPVLSIYKVLLEEGGDPEKVLEEVEELIRVSFFTSMLQGIRMLNLLPNPFPIIRPSLRWMTMEDYLPGSQEVVEDSRDCFALNVYRCFTLDTLTAHGAPELTTLFCNTDDWLSEAMPKVSWERTKTLGRGDEVCDFRWCRRK